MQAGRPPVSRPPLAHHRHCLATPPHQRRPRRRTWRGSTPRPASSSPPPALPRRRRGLRRGSGAGARCGRPGWGRSGGGGSGEGGGGEGGRGGRGAAGLGRKPSCGVGDVVVLPTLITTATICAALPSVPAIVSSKFGAVNSRRLSPKYCAFLVFVTGFFSLNFDGRPPRQYRLRDDRC